MLSLALEDGTLLPRDHYFTATVFRGGDKDEWGFQREGWEVQLLPSVYLGGKHRRMRFVVAPRDVAVSSERPGLVAKSPSFTVVASTEALRQSVAEEEFVLAVASETVAVTAKTDAWIAATRAQQQQQQQPQQQPQQPQQYWQDCFRAGRWVGRWLVGGAVDARLGRGAAAEGWRIHFGRPDSSTSAPQYIYVAPKSWPLGDGCPIDGQLFTSQHGACDHRSLLVGRACDQRPLQGASATFFRRRASDGWPAAVRGFRGRGGWCTGNRLQCARGRGSGGR